jgi:hypothetical protein
MALGDFGGRGSTFSESRLPELEQLFYEAFSVLKEEWREWFITAAERDVALHSSLLDAGSAEQRGLPARLAVEARTQAIKDIQHMVYPFCTGPISFSGVKFIRAVFRDNTISTEAIKQIHPIELRELCSVLTRAGTLKTIRSPLPETGRFAAIWRCLLPYMQKFLKMQYRAPDGTDPNWDAVMNYLLSNVLRKLKIDVIPWHHPTEQVAKLDVRHWRAVNNFQEQSGKRQLERLVPVGERSDAVLGKQIQAYLPSSSWSIEDVKLDEMSLFWGKTCPPDEFCSENTPFEEDPNEPGKVKGSPKMIPTSRDDPAWYVLETYNWAREHMDLADPWHKVLLFLSIIFSKACPHISKEKNCLSTARVTGDENAKRRRWTRLVRKVVWTDTNKKGVYDRGKVFTHMFVFCLAMYTPSSPLRIYMDRHKGSLGIQWNDRHSELFECFVFCWTECDVMF